MRRKATTILAVFITASASIACGGAADSNEPESGQTGQQPFAGDRTSEPPPAPTGAPAPTTPGTPPPATPPAACNRDALNSELSGVLLDTALQQHAHFRCLCDDKGYPLVGNINAKGASASQFCSAIKEKGLL
jgi:hypothetical protein